jgi:Cys-tRNA(Pro) deacylase
MSKQEIPVTQAIRLLKSHKVQFEAFFYEYEEKGGTHHTAIELEVDEHLVIKTLVLIGDSKDIFIVLQHGDLEVSLKELARILGYKVVAQCDQKTAMNATGYMFGGTSPFGTKKSLPVYAESSIFSLPKIYINGGKRGFIISIDPSLLKQILDINEVNTAIKKL